MVKRESCKRTSAVWTARSGIQARRQGCWWEASLLSWQGAEHMLSGSGSGRSSSRLDGRMRAAQPPLAADKCDWRKEEGPRDEAVIHFWSSQTFRKEEEKNVRTAVFTHLKPGNCNASYLSKVFWLLVIHVHAFWCILRARARTLWFIQSCKIDLCPIRWFAAQNYS